MVIMSMAWPTHEDGRIFSRMPNEPDLDTLTYWVTRLEPLIRAESDEEIIIVFCNRTGVEGETVYAGTSAVIGVKDGEVNVYGLLGRGEKELLIVDTDNPPFAKLIYRPDGESIVPSQLGELGDKTDVQVPPPPPVGGVSNPIRAERSKLRGTDGLTPASNEDEATKKVDIRHPIDTRLDSSKPNTRKNKPRSPKIQIPYSPSLAEVAAKLLEDAAKGQGTSLPGIPTPTGPSPTPQSVRPQLGEPELAKQKGNQHIATPHPNTRPSNDTCLFGGHVLVSNELFSPITSFEEPTPASPRYFWIPPDSLLKSPDPPRDWTHALPASPTFTVKAAIPAREACQQGQAIRTGSPTSPRGLTLSASRSTQPTSHQVSNSTDDPLLIRSGSVSPENDPAKVSSSQSRNASRMGSLEVSNSSLAWCPDINALNQRPDSISFQPAATSQQNMGSIVSGGNQPERPSSPKSRNASRSRPWLPTDDLVASQVQGSFARPELVSASPSLDGTGTPQQLSNCLYNNPEDASRPRVRQAHHIRNFSNSGAAYERPGSRQDTSLGSRIDRPQSCAAFESQAPDIPDAVSDGVSYRRASRGRQPASEGPFVDQKHVTVLGRSQSRRGLNKEDMARGQPLGPRSDSSQRRHGLLDVDIVRVSLNLPVHRDYQDEHSATRSAADTVEIVEIIRPSPSCPVHGKRRPTSSHQAMNRLSDRSGPSSIPEHQVGAACDASDKTSAVCGSSMQSTKSSQVSPAKPKFEPSTPEALVISPNDNETIPNTASTAPVVKSTLGFEQNTMDRPRSAFW